MKEQPFNFRQIEWWVITILFLVIVLGNILNTHHWHYNSDPIEMTRYFAQIFIPLAFFAAFYLMHMKIIPAYLKDGKTVKLILLGLIVFFLSFGIVSAFYLGSEYGQDVFIPFFFNITALYLGYLILTYIFQQILFPPKLKDYFIYNILRFIALYLFILFFLIEFERYHSHVILFVYIAIIPAIVAIIFYNYFLIYGNQKAGNIKKARYFYWGLISVPVLVLTVIAIVQGMGFIILVGFGIAALILVVIIPLSNLFFNKYEAVLGQISTLTYQIDQGSANLDFLRSQINPHFLFNALNTLYGTALQENSERTSEGIQKLGDMMRFMLHENNQEKIPVEREKEYLVNYVDLQLLRIKDQENVEIVFGRSEESCTGEIAPMLLIPFVENAFKHGISLQKKSWVKISLRCLAGSVHLDVNNSIHRTKEDDPEHKASGIGLDNVRQRLQLLYPKKHELIIRENELEYFVHLSIQLKQPHD